METWQWVALGVGAWFLYQQATKIQIPPYSGYGADGLAPQVMGPGQAVGNAVDNPTGANVGAAVDGVAAVGLSIADAVAGNAGRAPRLLMNNGDGGIVTAYDDPAGFASLEALRDRAPLGIVDAKPEQPAFGVQKVSPNGGGLWGVVPPRPQDPRISPYDSRAFGTLDATKSLSPRIGRIGR